MKMAIGRNDVERFNNNENKTAVINDLIKEYKKKHLIADEFLSAEQFRFFYEVETALKNMHIFDLLCMTKDDLENVVTDKVFKALINKLQHVIPQVEDVIAARPTFDYDMYYEEWSKLIDSFYSSIPHSKLDPYGDYQFNIEDLMSIFFDKELENKIYETMYDAMVKYFPPTREYDLTIKVTTKPCTKDDIEKLVENIANVIENDSNADSCVLKY